MKHKDVLEKTNKRRIPMKTKKRSLFLIVVLSISLTIILTQCKKEEQIEEPKIIKIGAILPLTGPAAWLGDNSSKGLSLGINKVNKELSDQNLNVKFELLIRDSKLDPKEAVSITRNFIDIENIKVIVANGTTIVNAIYPITEKNNIILFAQTIHPFITKSGKNIYRLYGGGDSEWKYLANYMNNKRIEDIGIFYINAQYGLDCIKVFRDNLNEINRISVEESYEIGSTDFRNIIVKNMNKLKDIDGIILMGYGSEFLPLLKQLNEFNIKKQIFGNIDFTFDFLVNYPLADGTIFVAPTYSTGFFNKKGEEFKDAYYKEYNKLPSWDIVNSFDTIMILKEILKKNEFITNALDFFKAFSEISEIEGASGLIKIDRYLKELYIPLKLAKIENQKIVPLEE